MSDTTNLWISPNGTPVPTSRVNNAALQRLYDTEADTIDPNAFAEAWRAANPPTRHAWRHGYRNPFTLATTEARPE